MRILHHAINGSGLGHLMRVTTIAARLRELDPEIHQLVVSSAPHADLLRRLGLPFLILPAGDGGPFSGIDRRSQTVGRSAAYAQLHRVVDEYDPELVVFDTHFGAALVCALHAEGRRLALVLRRCRASYLEGLFERGLLDRFARVLIPHAREEFDTGLPKALTEALAARPELVYVGPIVRRMDAAAASAVRARHRIPEGAKLVVITCGAGGIQHQAAAFLERAAEAALELCAGDSCFQILAVGGPSGAGARLPEGCAYVASEPDLPALFAQVELVIAQAGYNTVHEVLETSARAVFVPIERLNESQEDRVARLVAEGRATSVALSASRAEYVEALRGALSGPRPRPRSFDGRTRAAETLLGALPTSPRLVLGELQAPSVWTRVESEEALGERLRACGDRPSSVLIAWDRLSSLAALATASVRARWYVDLGEGDVERWTSRGAEALSRLASLGMDPANTTLVFTDASGGTALPPLADALARFILRGLIARVPRVVLAGTADVRFEALEACRRKNAPFFVDVTALEAPILAVDRR